MDNTPVDPRAPEESKYFQGMTLLVDKPSSWTSFDVVNKIRHKLKRSLQVRKIKVGHAGTLDPLATGLLIVCTGKNTKKIDQYQAQFKVYTGTIHLGATTPSYDAETEVDQTYPTEHITPELNDGVRQQLLGFIDQIPPMYSAIKVDGQPLYKKARKGVSVERKSRRVEIMSFALTRIELPEIDFEVQCSKGTYIRTLAYDFGRLLKSGAYLQALRRTQIGEFHIDNAWELENLVADIEENPWD